MTGGQDSATGAGEHRTAALLTTVAKHHGASRVRAGVEAMQAPAEQAFCGRKSLQAVPAPLSKVGTRRVMTQSKQASSGKQPDPLAGLAESVRLLVDAVVYADGEKAAETQEALLVRARDLLKRKQSKEAGKNETRDLLGELLFTRLRKGLRALLQTEDARTEIKAAEWVMGSLFAGNALQQFAAVLDRVILEAASPRDYSFAGLADFISLDEVLQMLGSGKHSGCLTLEKSDNKIDVWFHSGHIAYFDPYRYIRRVLPMADRMTFREIAPKLLEEAEQRHVRDSVPIIATLQEKGFFRACELRDRMRQLGTEVLFEFLLDDSGCAFFYKRMAELPKFALESDVRLGVTPVLLEGHKRIDDWRSMRKVFPDADQPVKALPDLFTRISSLDLGVLEIKLLSMIDGEKTIEQLAPMMGLPMYDVYHCLVRFAREGVIQAPGGIESLRDLSLSFEESMELAFEALDANDDEKLTAEALDKVLGEETEKTDTQDVLGSIFGR
jgi:hypothetical protein